jgi:hypothetical protein
MVDTPASYSEGPGFKSRLGDRLSSDFSWFPQSLQPNAGMIIIIIIIIIIIMSVVPLGT